MGGPWHSNNSMRGNDDKRGKGVSVPQPQQPWLKTHEHNPPEGQRRCTTDWDVLKVRGTDMRLPQPSATTQPFQSDQPIQARPSRVGTALL